MKTKQQILNEQKQAIKNRLTCLEMLETVEPQYKDLLIDNYTYWTQIDNHCTVQLANYNSIEIANPIFERYG